MTLWQTLQELWAVTYTMYARFLKSTRRFRICSDSTTFAALHSTSQRVLGKKVSCALLRHSLTSVQCVLCLPNPSMPSHISIAEQGWRVKILLGGLRSFLEPWIFYFKFPSVEVEVFRHALIDAFPYSAFDKLVTNNFHRFNIHL